MNLSDACKNLSPIYLREAQATEKQWKNTKKLVSAPELQA